MGANRGRGLCSATLVEVIVALGMAGFVLAPLVWAMVSSFRLGRAVHGELDVTIEAYRVLRVLTREIAASRGLVTFSPAGGSGAVQGLQLPDGRLVVYRHSPDGEIVRLEYGRAPHEARRTDRVGAGIRYLHLVPLERGVHVALELQRLASIGDGDPGRLELSTVVAPRGW